VLKRDSCWRGQDSKKKPVATFRVASRTELGRPIKGSEWGYKVYNYDLGEKYQGFERESRRRGQGFFRKIPSSHNRWPLGRSLADLSVHCRNIIIGCERRSNLERNTTEEEIGGQKAPVRLRTNGCMPCKWLESLI
jgi:hypothetical protein